MSKYDTERQALGLSPIGGSSSVNYNSGSRYALERKTILSGQTASLTAIQPVQTSSTSANEPAIRQWNPSLLDRLESLNIKESILSGVPNGIFGGLANNIFNKISNVSYKKAEEKGQLPYGIPKTPEPYKPQNAVEQGLSFIGSIAADAPIMAFNPGRVVVSKTMPTTLKPIAKSALGEAITGGALGATQGVVTGESPSEIAKRAAFGAALGGGLGAAGQEIVSKLARKKPTAEGAQAWQDIQNAYKVPGQKESKLTPSDLIRVDKTQNNLGKMEITVPDGYKIRGFNKTIVDSPNTAPEVSQPFKLDPMTYKPIGEAEYIAAANKRIADDIESAVQYVKQTKTPSSEHTATAIQLINKFQQEGNYNRAIDLVEDIAPKLTRAGQAIQAASIYNKLSPEGILLYAQRRITQLNNKRLLPGLTKEFSLTGEDAGNLRRLAENVKDLSGDAKIEASQELQSALQGLGKSGIDRKIESGQTIAQLLNPKTLIRNTVGNELFYRLERINKYVASPIDWARSAITGVDRTVTFRTAGQGGYWQGFFKGAKAGWKGVSPQGLSTQYDLTAPAFTGKWNPLTYMEKALGATLKGFDFAAYNRAVNQTLGEMAELVVMNLGLRGEARKIAIQNFIKNADKNLLDIADQYGKFVTFQDANILSKGLSAIKRGANVGYEFGLGSIILKYPRTPGALIMRGLDYSPAGFLRSAYELARPILKGEAVNSRNVMLSLSRAITGSLGFTGLGWLLADNGVITGQVNKDADVRELEKATGGGSFKVNASALARWVTSGFNSRFLQRQSGDTMISYDWAQPIAMAISFGANMNQNVKEGKSLGENAPGVLASSLEGALNTIAEQPVLSGLLRAFQGYSLGDNFINTIKSVPASFVPTLINQIRQIADNTGRNTYDPNVFYESMNMVGNKIPGIEADLPTAYTTAGEPKELYQKNNWFNVFFNPANVTNFKPTTTQAEILRIYNSTGDKIQFPRVAAKSFKWKEKTIDLTGQEQSEYQRILGQETEAYFNKIINAGVGGYKLMSDTKKAELLQKAINQSNEIAKREVLRKRGLVR